jgi:hypothetical protein
MNFQVNPKEKAQYLIQTFMYELNIRDWEKSKNCSIYLCHNNIRETLDVDKIKYWKSVVIEIEKL